MDEAERQYLVENFRQTLTWNGDIVTLGGYKNADYCSIVCSAPGFWRADWEAVARAAECGNFDNEILWAGNGAWLGLPR